MVYIYVRKTQKGNYEIDGYDDKTGRDLWKRSYMYFSKREAIARFKEAYNVKYQRHEIINL